MDAEQSDWFVASLTEEGRYRLLVEAVTDYAIYMLDSEGIVTSWNPGAERFKGYIAKEIIGSHFSRFYTEEDRLSGLPARALATAAREGKFESEGWRVRKDGTRFWAYVIIDPIQTPDGKIVGYAKVTRDLTERRQAQQDLDKARDALRQSQKMDAIGQLTGGVAHDFNNLLMAILGSLELLRKRLPDDPKMIALLENAIQGAERGKSLTQRMLAFARRQDLNPEPVDVPALVRGMTDLLQSSLGSSVTIETHFPLVLEAAHADANQLELALLNLAVNARDAMGDTGKITIAARAHSVLPNDEIGLPPGRYVCLSVTDTGEGMDEATLERAMEPFFTTKGVGKGTGLGLPMAHGMAEQLGGRLRLISTPGKGTTAEIWLPVASSKPAAEVSLSVAEKRTFEKLVVLAVDDDSLVLMNTTAMLEELGHTVLEASSGKQALDILRKNLGIDLVITDQAMPNMTGVHLAQAIREEWPSVRVMLATGYTELPPGSPVLPKISKPFGQGELAQAIAALAR